ncbi:MAG: putative molybdenum carrier protein [Bacteroidales bacterium]
MMKELKIISGGQTGVDRAALDVALEHSVVCGGWVLPMEEGLKMVYYPTDIPL